VSADPIDLGRAQRFLRALRRNNDRVWFAAHRAVYDEHIRPEWEDLVAALLVAAVAFDERFAYVEPRTCIFRLARDIRFSRDKTPFKTHLSAWLSPFGKNGRHAGFYLEIDPAGARFAAGIYTPEQESLAALRRHFADDARPFGRIVSAQRFAPYLPLRTDGLQRSPRGFPKEHPHLELIRARRYIVRRPLANGELAERGVLATFRAMMRDCAPFVAYLDRVAAAGE
jgi:uncharacterized protein (TIGR02453 family)